MLLTSVEVDAITRCISWHSEYLSNGTKPCSDQEIPVTVPVSNSECFKLCNSYIECQYLLNKEQYQMKEHFEERWLFHITGQDRIDEIKDTNLDYRKVIRAKYGDGVSFSPHFDYGNTHASRNIGCRRVAIIAKVLIGSEDSGNYDGSFDTTDVGNVVVKYCDNEFYPEYLVYYTNPIFIRKPFFRRF